MYKTILKQPPIVIICHSHDPIILQICLKSTHWNRKWHLNRKSETVWNVELLHIVINFRFQCRFQVQSSDFTAPWNIELICVVSYLSVISKFRVRIMRWVGEMRKMKNSDCVFWRVRCCFNVILYINWPKGADFHAFTNRPNRGQFI